MVGDFLLPKQKSPLRNAFEAWLNALAARSPDFRLIAAAAENAHTISPISGIAQINPIYSRHLPG
jgi:hypothetical protein